MRGYRLSIVRHGLTSANDNGIYIGSRSDYSLSEKGINQLWNKKDEFDYPKVERVYSSPMKRCLETAEILFPYREVQTVENMTELDFGEFDGKSVNELIDREDYKKWLKGGSPDMRPPGGESMEELMLRLYKGLHEIIMDMMNEELVHCAVVTHSGIISNMLYGFGLPKIDPKELACAPGEGYEILVTAKMWQQSQAFEILGKIPY
ncbi:MAG: histidine phosphatase family protein [Clostridium sp.]|nr:histidine phosphatase family protein [Clostridium sp.]MCM1548179.1 histidine phosphatase family protein [Ruminococcus sp.]